MGSGVKVEVKSQVAVKSHGWGQESKSKSRVKVAVKSHGCGKESRLRSKVKSKYSYGKELMVIFKVKGCG